MKASIFIRYFCGSVAVLLLWQLGSVTSARRPFGAQQSR